jgi:hypothetical protein
MNDRTITITITHTRSDGTLLEGSSKGDGVLEVVRPFGFRFFPSLGVLGIVRSRDRAAQMHRINGAKAALEEAGWAVRLHVDEDIARSFAEAEAERSQRAGERAERFTARSARASAASDAARARSDAISEHIPLGQPILIGHHSEARARRDAERITAGMQRSVDEHRRARYWEGRAEAAAGHDERRHDPERTLRRIEKLKTDQRRIRRTLGKVTPGTDWARELRRQDDELSEQIAYWECVIRRAVEAGHKVWGPDDFTKGDFVHYGSRWLEVLRVNRKTLTVPSTLRSNRRVVRYADSGLTFTDKLAYTDGIKGRRSADEMDQDV